MSEVASAVRLAVDGFKQVLQSCGRNQGKQAGPARKETGVCEKDRTAILNRGSGGQGQPHIGIVWQETSRRNGIVPIPGFLALVKEYCGPTSIADSASFHAPH